LLLFCCNDDDAKEDVDVDEADEEEDVEAQKCGCLLSLFLGDVVDVDSLGDEDDNEDDEEDGNEEDCSARRW